MLSWKCSILPRPRILKSSQHPCKTMGVLSVLNMRSLRPSQGRSPPQPPARPSLRIYSLLPWGPGFCCKEPGGCLRSADSPWEGEVCICRCDLTKSKCKGQRQRT